MKTIADSYTPYADSRRVNLSFVFGVVSPGASSLAQPSSSEQAIVSQIAQSHDEIEEMTSKYASLEQDIFLLDGSFSIYPDNTSLVQVGWQSANMSNANGTFTTSPWLEFSFPEPQDSYGFTLLFDDKVEDDYPTQVQTTVYNASGTVLQTKTTEPNSWSHVIDMPIQGYSKVHFEFLKTNQPYRRIRVCEVRFGINYEYGCSNLENVTVKQSISPWAANLPSTEVSAVVDNSDQLYNMVNPAGLYAYLQDGQFMEYHIEINGVRIPMGKQYFTNAESEDGGLTANITFNDWLYILDDVEYNNGTTGTWTLQEAISDILSTAGIDKDSVYEGTVGTVVIQKCIPQKTSCREAIRICAQAAMCTCFIDNADVLHFIRPSVLTKVDEWTQDVQHSDAQVKVGQLYNVVQITARNEYIENGEDVIYTAKNVAAGDFERIYEVTNPLVVDGNLVAEWILSWVQRRVSYEVTYRGNPALDLLDTIQIDDVYQVNGLAILTQQNFEFDGGLSATATAIR